MICSFRVIYLDIRSELFSLQDKKYREFQASLVPNIQPECIIGVRIPQLRKLARKAAADDSVTIETYYYEERMLIGMRVGYAKCDFERRLEMLRQFVPLIDNWAVCDSCCSTFKFTLKHLDEMWQFILPYLDKSEYEARFAIIMMMDYYLTDEYIDRVLQLISSVQREEYYINMGAAWALATAYVRYPEKVLKLIKSSVLSDEIHNKTIRKIRESFRVSKEDKEMLLTLKRKK